MNITERVMPHRHLDQCNVVKIQIKMNNEKKVMNVVCRACERYFWPFLTFIEKCKNLECWWRSLFGAAVELLFCCNCQFKFSFPLPHAQTQTHTQSQANGYRMHFRGKELRENSSISNTKDFILISSKHFHIRAHQKNQRICISQSHRNES